MKYNQDMVERSEDKYRQYNGYLLNHDNNEIVLVGSKIDPDTGDVEEGHVFLRFNPEGEFKNWLVNMVGRRVPITAYFSRSEENTECTFAYNLRGRVVLKTFDNLETKLVLEE